MWKARIVASGIGKCLGCMAIIQYCCLFSSPNVRSVDFASFQPLRSQCNPSRLVFGLHWCPNTILNYNLFLPVHPPPPTQYKHPWCYLAHRTSQNFLSYLAGTFVVLGKLSDTVKCSTFCVSFVRVLTFNVLFGMVSINPVTYASFSL